LNWNRANVQAGYRARQYRAGHAAPVLLASMRRVAISGHAAPVLLASMRRVAISPCEDLLTVA
jgi:hypothetical protein